MKALRDYGIKLADLKTAVKGLNDAGILDTKLKVVGVKGEELLVNFLDAIEGLSDEQASNLPKAVDKFYEDIPQEVFDEVTAIMKKSA